MWLCETSRAGCSFFNVLMYLCFWRTVSTRTSYIVCRLVLTRRQVPGTLISAAFLSIVKISVRPNILHSFSHDPTSSLITLSYLSDCLADYASLHLQKLLVFLKQYKATYACNCVFYCIVHGV